MKKQGRPPLAVDREKLLAGIAGHRSIRLIAKDLGCSYMTAYRWVKREKPCAS